MFLALHYVSPLKLSYTRSWRQFFVQLTNLAEKQRIILLIAIMKSLLSVQGVPGSPGSRGPPVSNVHVVEDSIVNSVRVIWKTAFSDLLFQNLLFVRFRGKEVDLCLDRKEMRYNHAPFLLTESAAREQPREAIALCKSHIRLLVWGRALLWLIYLLFSFHYKLYKLHFTIDNYCSNRAARATHQYCVVCAVPVL